MLSDDLNKVQMKLNLRRTRMADVMRAVKATGKGNNMSNGNWSYGGSPGFGSQPGPKTRNVEPKEAEGFFKDLMEEVKAARQVMNELQKTVEAITGKSNGQDPSFNVYANLAFLRKRAESSIEARIEVSEVGDQGPTLVRNHLMQLNEDSDAYYLRVSDINLRTLRITYKLDTTGNVYVLDKVEREKPSVDFEQQLSQHNVLNNVWSRGSGEKALRHLYKSLDNEALSTMGFAPKEIADIRAGKHLPVPPLVDNNDSP